MGKQKLQPVPARDSNTTVPGSEAVMKCFATASTVKGVEYMAEKFGKILTKAKVENSDIMLKRVQDHVANVKAQLDRRSPFGLTSEDDVKTDFQNMQQNLADAAMERLRASLTDDLRVDFAVSAYADLLRAFTADGKELDPEVVEALDALVNATLAEDDMISKDGVIYKATAAGQPEKDAAGNPVRANGAEVVKVISGPFVEALKDNGIETVLQQHEYPQEEQVAAKPAAVEPAPAPAPEPAVQPEVTPTPDTPAAGSGMGSGAG